MCRPPPLKFARCCPMDCAGRHRLSPRREPTTKPTASQLSSPKLSLARQANSASLLASPLPSWRLEAGRSADHCAGLDRTGLDKQVGRARRAGGKTNGAGHSRRQAPINRRHPTGPSHFLWARPTVGERPLWSQLIVALGQLINSQQRAANKGTSISRLLSLAITTTTTTRNSSACLHSIRAESARGLLVAPSCPWQSCLRASRSIAASCSHRSAANRYWQVGRQFGRRQKWTAPL